MKKLILSTIILLMLTTLTAFSMNDDLLNMEFPDIPEIEMPEEDLLLEANKWELSHGGLSGRTAQQFIDYLMGQN